MYNMFSAPPRPSVPVEQMARPIPLISRDTQTASGIQERYVRPQHGPAGLPDSRIICPRCKGEHWFIDVISLLNPLYNDPPSVNMLESRMTCLACGGDVWNVDLLTRDYPFRPYPPTAVPKVNVAEGRTPLWGQRTYTERVHHIGHMDNVTPQVHGMVNTPESGYGSGVPPPDMMGLRHRTERPLPGATLGAVGQLPSRSVSRQLRFGGPRSGE